MPRREFSRKVRAKIIFRATDENGRIVCEGCGLVLGHKPYQIDHTLPDALDQDREKVLTAEDGKLLGSDCCHKPKTANDIRQIRKADRQRDKHTGAMKRKGPPFPGSRSSNWKKKLSGELVRR